MKEGQKEDTKKGIVAQAVKPPPGRIDTGKTTSVEKTQVPRGGSKRSKTKTAERVKRLELGQAVLHDADAEEILETMSRQ